MGCGSSTPLSKAISKKEAKWVAELSDDKGYFLPFAEWKKVIEGSTDEDAKEANEEKESKAQIEAKKKGCEVISARVLGSVLSAVNDAGAKMLSRADVELQGKGLTELSSILNCLSAVAETYLYEASAGGFKDRERFQSLRAHTIDNLVLALAAPFVKARAAAEAAGIKDAVQGAVDAAGAAGAKAGEGAEKASDSVESSLAQLDAAIAAGKGEAQSRLEMMLAVSSAKAEGAGDERAEAVQGLAVSVMQSLQGMAAEKVEALVGGLKRALRRMLTTAEAAAETIQRRGARAKEGTDAAADPDYDKVRDELRKQVEGAHAHIVQELGQAVAAAVYGSAQLAAPEAVAEVELSEEDGGGRKSKMKQRLQDKTAKLRAKVHAKWAAEVYEAEAGRYKVYAEWKRLYGPKEKQKEEGGAAGGKAEEEKVEDAAGAAESGAAAAAGAEEEEEEEEPAGETAEERAERQAKFLQLVAKLDLAGRVSRACVAGATRLSCEAAGRADAAARGGKLEAVGRSVNCVAAVAYSFYFVESGGARRCRALRSAAVARLATALAAAVEAVEAAATAAPPTEPTEAQVKERSARLASQIVEGIVAAIKDKAAAAIPARAQDKAGSTVPDGTAALVRSAAEDAVAGALGRGLRALEPDLTQMAAAAYAGKRAVAEQAKLQLAAVQGQEVAAVPGYAEVQSAISQQVDAAREKMVSGVDAMARDLVAKMLALAVKEGGGDSESAASEAAASESEPSSLYPRV